MENLMIAWYPEKLVAPAELTAVLVNPGVLEEKTWIAALADRVTDLALQEENPLKAAEQACKAMGLVLVDNENQLGDVLVTHNTELRTYLNLCQIEEQFPTLTSPSEEAEQVIADINLASWVEYALAHMSSSSLD